jgi:beta-galactosidase
MNRQLIDLTGIWQFCLGDVTRWTRVDHQTCYDATKAGGQLGNLELFLRDNPWREVPVPHDWCTELASAPENHPSNGFKPRGKGWYYRNFTLPNLSEGETVLLEFDGVMGESEIYVNGTRAMRSFSGYTGFYCDITNYVLPGEENMIAVSVDTTRWEGWWYEGAGIYRPVRAIVQPAVHFKHLSTFVRADRTDDARWVARVETIIECDLRGAEDLLVECSIKDASGTVVASAQCTASVLAYESVGVKMEIPLEHPALWSPDAPNLYGLAVRLYEGGKLIDSSSARFGCREIVWTDRGMYINGECVMVKGICCHQDHAGVGIAALRSLNRYRLEKLKAMGCNAYRCAHNAVSEDFLDLCDEVGMLVMAENRHFTTSDETMEQLDSLVLRARNHPSVFLYSLFNEEPWQAEPRGRRIAETLLRRVRALDPTRPVTAAMNGGVLAHENASDVLDVAGINYFIDDYMAYAARRPGKPMVATENGPIYATRSVYKSDPEQQIYDCYGETYAFFGQRLEDTMEAVNAAPHVAGVFMWGGFDYRGEPQPFEWPSVFSHWGFHDNCGFEKDTAFLLKSYYAKEPVLHLMPHWNWAPGESVRVCVFSNCPSVRLFLNDRLIGEKAVERNRAEWIVPFEPGTLRAEADVNGETIAHSVITAGAPAGIDVKNAAEGRDTDALILNVDLVDEHGVHVPDDDRKVRISIEGGVLLGSGNGDPNGTQPDRAPAQMTFAGRCQFIVQPQNSFARVTISSDGLPDAVFPAKQSI